MKNDYYSIGEVSEIKDVSVKALRFYEKIGLLKPFFVDPLTRYRYYHASQFMIIDVIKAARCMQISPNALVPYFANKDTAGLVALIDKHKDEISARIASLQNVLDTIDGATDTLSAAREANKNGCVFERTIPERHVITIPFGSGKIKDDFIADYSKLDTLVSIRGLGNKYEAGVIYAQSELGFYPGSIFTSISSKADGYDDYRSIPEGRYFCIVVTKDNAEKQVKKLFTHIENKGMTPQLMVSVELLTDLFVTESEYHEFQVKV